MVDLWWHRYTPIEIPNTRFESKDKVAQQEGFYVYRKRHAMDV